MEIYLVGSAIIFLAGMYFTMQKGRKKSLIIFLFISFGIMAITLGFRGIRVGEDTHTYIEIANKASRLSWKEIISEFPRSEYGAVYYLNGASHKETIESGYLILNKLIMQLFHDTLYVQFAVASIICIGFAKFIYDNSENIFFSVWIFLCESLYMFAFNGQRQMMAMAIGIQAYTKIKNGDYVKALIYVLIASMFHMSACIYLILIPISGIKKYKTGIKVCIMAMGIIALMLSFFTRIVSIIFPRYASYLTTSFWKGSVGGIVIIWMIEIVIFIIMYRRIENGVFQDYMILASIPLYIGFELIGIQYTAVSRVALYFRVFVLLLFPAFFKCIKGKNIKLLYMFGIMAITFLQYYSAISLPTRLYSFM